MIINIFSLKTTGLCQAVSSVWLTLLLLSFVSKGLLAQAGALDPTFSQDGKAIASIGRDYGRSVLIQPDGKIVVAGTTKEDNIWKFVLLRFTPEGDLDSSFNGTGKVTVDFQNTSSAYVEAWDAVLQADGKILICGYRDATGNGQYDWAVSRVNNDGTLDTSFDGDGVKTINMTSGSSYDQARAITYNKASEKITVVGKANLDIGLVRLNPNGSFDNTFGSNGKVITDLPNGTATPYAAIQMGDTVWIGGAAWASSKSRGFVAKYNGEGNLDQSFGTNGFVTIEQQDWVFQLFALCRQPDGKILAAGTASHTSSDSSEIFLARMMPEGQFDSSFGLNGILILNISTRREEAWEVMYDTVRQKIILAGFSEKNGGRQFALARFNPNGLLDNEFGTNGLVLTTVGMGWAECNAATLQADGKIVSAGHLFNGVSYDFALTRHLQDGLNAVINYFREPKNVLIINPNPAGNKSYFQYSLLKTNYVTVDLWDSFGHLARTLIAQEQRNAGKHSEEFSTEGLPAGFYYLILRTSSGGIWQGRFIKN